MGAFELLQVGHILTALLEEDSGSLNPKGFEGLLVLILDLVGCYNIYARAVFALCFGLWLHLSLSLHDGNSLGRRNSVRQIIELRFQLIEGSLSGESYGSQTD